MPQHNLNKEFVRKLQLVQHARRVSYFDTDITGFMLEYRPSGTATWYLRYRNEERKSRMLRIGRLSEVNAVDAREMAYRFLRDIKSGRLPEGKKYFLRTHTFSEFVEEAYMPHACIKKRSFRQDEIMLRLYILPELGTRRIEYIMQRDIVCWQADMIKRGLAASTINRIMGLLRHIFSCAMRWGARSDNPCCGVSFLPDNSARQRYLVPEETKTLLSVLDTVSNRRLAAFIHLLLLTGARKSELLRAKWEDIDISRRQLKVKLSKSGKTRFIPLSEEALHIIASLTSMNSPWLFPGRKGGPMALNFRLWKKIRECVGIEDVHLHDLRHTYASILVEKGCSLYEVQKILGHQTPKMTMRYAHLSAEHLIKAADLVAESVTTMKNA